jgi:hypothetical protein
MSDPHIDLDDIDNTIPKARAEGPASGPDPSSAGADDFDANSTWRAAGRFGANVFSDFARRFQGRSGFGTGGGPFDEFFPKEARQHFRASQREWLLGWRTLIDSAIERLDEREAREQNPPSGDPNKIIVEEIDI